MKYFAHCRSEPLTLRGLMAQVRHALRKDKTSKERKRPEAKAGAALHWLNEDRLGLNYVSQLKAHVRRLGAGFRKNAPVCLHIQAGVTPEWVKETGGLHDPKNPRNLDLIGAAVDWANGWSGGSVLAARMDLDERGGALVDLFVSPVEMARHKLAPPRPMVSVNACLERLSMAICKRKGSHYGALNSSWADYAAANLDPRLERGERKSKTGREHVHPDVLRRALEAEREALEAMLGELKRGTLRLQDGRLSAAAPEAFRGSTAWGELKGLVVDLLKTADGMRSMKKEPPAYESEGIGM